MITFAEIPTVRQSLLGDVAPQNKPDLVQRLSLIQKDIVKLQVDAIVNAANESLLGGGGVDGCIHRAAGPGLLAECRTLHGCAPGSSVITKGYKLPASHVIHTVGPRNKDANVLKSCYETSLALCSENGLKTVAFPCIATGIFGFPNRAAADIAIQTSCSYLESHPEVERIIFCCFLDEDFQHYKELLCQRFKV
ncbi:hypothetical protein AAHC03_010053 [Spirometra sp. Aus1]